jgi:hypothetical protein
MDWKCSKFPDLLRESTFVVFCSYVRMLHPYVSDNWISFFIKSVFIFFCVNHLKWVGLQYIFHNHFQILIKTIDILIIILSDLEWHFKCWILSILLSFCYILFVCLDFTARQYTGHIVPNAIKGLKCYVKLRKMAISRRML